MYFRISRHLDRRWDNDKGFTIIELSVVVSIILILASALIIPGARRFVNAAREKEAIAELQVMKSVLDTYFANYGQFPSGPDQHLSNNLPYIGDVLQEKGINWNDYSDTGLEDPWGMSYFYRTYNWHRPGAMPFPRRYHYIIICRGPDKLKENVDDIYVTENCTPSKDLTNIRTNPDFNYNGGPNEPYESYSSCIR